VHWEQNKPADPIDLDLEIGFALPSDASSVIKIAAESFEISRLHQDPNIPNSIANQIKADWVANYFKGLRGDNMVVVRENNQVIGFLLLINKTLIDLIAVSKVNLNRKIASFMIGFANKKIGPLKAGTQITNQASIALYQKTGFTLRYAQYVLHKLVA
jgi:hypothetical protein